MDVNDLPVHFGYDDDYAGSETETEASYSIPRQNSQPDDVLQLIKRGLSPINLSNSTRWKDTMEISPVRQTRSATKARLSEMAISPIRQTRSASKSRQSSSATMVSSPSPKGKGNPPVQKRQHAGHSNTSSEHIKNLNRLVEAERRPMPNDVKWPKKLFVQKPPTCNELRQFIKPGSSEDELKLFHSRVLALRTKVNAWCRKTVKMAIVRSAKMHHMKYRGRSVSQFKEVGKSWRDDDSEQNARKVFIACIGQFESEDNAWMIEKELECLKALKLKPDWCPNGKSSFVTSALKRQRSLLLRDVNNSAAVKHGSMIRVRRTREQTANQPIYRRGRKGDPTNMILVRSGSNDKTWRREGGEDDASTNDASNNSTNSEDRYDDTHVEDVLIVDDEDASTNHTKRSLAMEDSPISRKSHRSSSTCDATSARRTQTVVHDASQSSSNVARISKSINTADDSRSCMSSTGASEATQPLLDKIRYLEDQRRISESKLRAMKKVKADLKERNALDAIRKKDEEEKRKQEKEQSMETACLILKESKKR